jgi:predicted Rossmann fold flavoprotein
MSADANSYDVIILGAGASGLMCAIEAGKRQRRVLVLDHADQPGSKILLAGGGRCNFSNYSVEADNYLSTNPHFCKSALSRFSQWDFLELVQRYQIPFHERQHGQLFCDDSSRDILQMLLTECRLAGVAIELGVKIGQVEKLAGGGFRLSGIRGDRGDLHCRSLVVATGGLSIPNAGAGPFGYRLAEQFGIKVLPTSAGLVPLTLQPAEKQRLATLSGIAVRSRVGNGQQSFCENLLFTHRGLSGPVILQISNYWQPGQQLTIDLLPDVDLLQWLKSKQQGMQKQLKTVLAELLPKRLLATFFTAELLEMPLRNLSDQQLAEVAACLQQWLVKPNGTEGYRTAEVTRGGIDCNQISSKTLEARQVSGLFFIGELLDVTGWLGGYNLQWAWSSGWSAGQVV